MHLLVLSAFRPEAGRYNRSLKASVSMHLLVLSAFRLAGLGSLWLCGRGSQCTFWCSVLSDRNASTARSRSLGRSQCTFWCSVLSDGNEPVVRFAPYDVSMHLLVLSAFRQDGKVFSYDNAQVSMHLLVLSAFRREGLHRRSSFLPRRSQCTFWCSVLSDRLGALTTS